MKLSKAVLGERLFTYLMKSTFYGHFVAGEDEVKIRPTLSRLRQFGVKPILDYSVEEDITQEEAERREVQWVFFYLNDFFFRRKNSCFIKNLIYSQFTELRYPRRETKKKRELWKSITWKNHSLIGDTKWRRQGLISTWTKRPVNVTWTFSSGAWKLSQVREKSCANLKTNTDKIH